MQYIGIFGKNCLVNFEKRKLRFKKKYLKINIRFNNNRDTEHRTPQQRHKTASPRWSLLINHCDGNYIFIIYSILQVNDTCSLLLNLNKLYFVYLKNSILFIAPRVSLTSNVNKAKPNDEQLFNLIQFSQFPSVDKKLVQK